MDLYYAEFAKKNNRTNGGGLKHKFRLKFEVSQKGQTMLHLDYKQPRDKDIPHEKTYEGMVVVQ